MSKQGKAEKNISLPVRLEETQWIIEDSNRQAIARSCAEANTTREQMRANSEFICTAVNNHDKLVEALERSLNRISFIEQYTDGKVDSSIIKDEIRELLKSITPPNPIH